MLDELKSASEIVNAVNDKKIKAQEVTEFFIERITVGAAKGKNFNQLDLIQCSGAWR